MTNPSPEEWDEEEFYELTKTMDGQDRPKLILLVSSFIDKVRQEERRKAFTMNSGFFEKGRQEGIHMERERLLAWIEQEIQIPPADEYQAQRNATLIIIRRIITNPTDGV